MHFHCDSKLLHEFDRVAVGLAAHEIPLDLNHHPPYAVGHVEGELFCLEEIARRFCGNLRVLDYPKLTALMDSPVADRIRAALESLGMTYVESPLRAEIEYVEARFPMSAEMKDTIWKFWHTRTLVERAVVAQRWEDAVEARDRSACFLDRLYELCKEQAEERFGHGHA